MLPRRRMSFYGVQGAPGLQDREGLSRKLRRNAAASAQAIPWASRRPKTPEQWRVPTETETSMGFQKASSRASTCQRIFRHRRDGLELQWSSHLGKTM